MIPLYVFYPSTNETFLTEDLRKLDLKKTIIPSGLI